jgi:hypothetical protein
MNHNGKVIERHGTIRVARRTKSECFAVVCDHLFELLHPTQLLIASMNRSGKVVEGHGTTWVARRTESKCFAEVCDHLFEILHFT